MCKTVVKDQPKYKVNNPEISDIFKIHSAGYDFFSIEQKKVVNSIIKCRTACLGGHVLKCDNCGSIEISYNSCRNRHCPKCQSLAKARWIMARREELLPVPYFHIVFTISDVIYPLALQNKKVIYDILFKASSLTLKEVAVNPKNLNADIGFISILHTWNQKLLDHPHIHCIVAGGGLSKDKSRWISSSENYFLPVKVIGKVFRGKFLSYLEEAFKARKLKFYGKITELCDYNNFKQLLKDSCKSNWIVYSKRPFAGPQQVLDYLGRYTHRVAISNNRLVSMTDTKISFNWRDRKNANRLKIMELDVFEFMRRFLLHVLPSGFIKIRHYGFLGSPVKKKLIALCRKLITGSEVEDKENQEGERKSWQEIMIFLTGVDPSICENCGKGHMFVFKEFSKEVTWKQLKAG